MSFTSAALGGLLGGALIEDDDLGATLEQYVSGAKTLYQVAIDNADNGSAVFVKCYDATAGVTVGTTAPEYVFVCPAGKKLTYTVPDGLDFGTGIGAACVTAGGTGGTTAPTNAVRVKLLTS